MLHCAKCRKDKDESEFHRSSRHKTGYQSYCKECNKGAVRKHIQDNPGHNAQVRLERRTDLRERMRDYKKEQGCFFCPENEPVCLELHHKDPETKVMDPSSAILRSWDFFLEEAAKCVVLCANCHRKVHVGLLNLSGA